MIVIIILISLFRYKIMFKKMRKIIRKMKIVKSTKKDEENWEKDERAEIAEMMMYDMAMTK
jgi:hypothetical protein